MTPMLAETKLDLGHWHHDTYRVYHKDIDFRSDFRLSALLTMLQESAWNHARVLGIDYSQAGFQDKHWVMSRLRVRFTAPPPAWMEDTLVATYPSGVNRLFANREFVAYQSGRPPFALASSSWVIINASTRQLCRPEQYLAGFQLVPTPVVLEGGPARLKDFAGGDWLADIRPGYQDVDAHRHVNNVRYAEWCLAVLDPDFFATHVLREFEVNFLSEATWNDSLGLYRQSDGPVQDYSLRKADGTAAAVLRFVWEARPAASDGA